MAERQNTFAPTADFTAQANINDPNIYDEAAADPQSWWAQQAETLLDWTKPWDTVCEWNPPHAKWFVGGQLNVAANCLDRHLTGARRNKAALIFEGEPGDTRVLTYWDLHREVCKLSNVLLSLGIVKGERVTITCPPLPRR